MGYHRIKTQTMQTDLAARKNRYKSKERKVTRRACEHRMDRYRGAPKMSRYESKPQLYVDAGAKARRYRQANFDFRFCSSSIRDSNCARLRSFSRRSSPRRDSSDCFSSTIDFRTVTTSRRASCSSLRRLSVWELSESRSLASSLACIRALRTARTWLIERHGKQGKTHTILLRV